MRHCIDNATTDMHACGLADYANTHNVQGMESVGDRVKRRRIALKLTQEELAERSRRVLSTISQGTISRIEKGETENPDSKTLQAIAHGLGIGAEELLGGTTAVSALSPTQSERELPTAMNPNEAESPLEAAIGYAYDKSRHSLRDTDAVRAALRENTRSLFSESEMIEAATYWLDVAARLRRRGDLVTAQSLLLEVTRENLRRHETADPAPEGHAAKPKR